MCTTRRTSFDFDFAFLHDLCSYSFSSSFSSLPYCLLSYQFFDIHFSCLFLLNRTYFEFFSLFLYHIFRATIIISDLSFCILSLSLPIFILYAFVYIPSYSPLPPSLSLSLSLSVCACMCVPLSLTLSFFPTLFLCLILSLST